MPVDARFECLPGCGYSPAHSRDRKGVPRGARWRQDTLPNPGVAILIAPPRLALSSAPSRGVWRLERSAFAAELIGSRNTRPGSAQNSTTKSSPLVVENQTEKYALKGLVEAFLLAFCPTCRRADILDSLSISTARTFVFRTGRSSDRPESRFVGTLPGSARQSPSRPYFQSNFKRGIL
jgi:hypothetical protein